MLPTRVDITDVCPRDGFQNIETFIPTEVKIEIVKALIDAGVKSIEATSFVNPKWVPQMADARDVVQAIKPYALDKGVQLIALAPNRRGFDDAVAAGVDTVSFVVSVSEAHNKNNVNKTPRESMDQFREIAQSRPSDVRLRLALATTFGCPFGTIVTPDMVEEMVRVGLDAGADEILLADTIGSANPLQVERIVSGVKAIAGDIPVALHLHDTRGLALANMYQAIQCGITHLETATGGLGGCPYAPGASGNAATEDALNMFAALGIETNISAEGINKVLDLLRNKIRVPLNSHMSSLKFGVCAQEA